MLDHISNSSLKSIATCTTLAYLQHVIRLPEKDTAPLMSGKAGHEALGEYVLTGDIAKAEAKYEKLYRPWAEAYVEPGDRLSFVNTADILGRWLREHPLARSPFTYDPTWVERKLELEDSALGIKFTGVLDGLVRDKALGEEGIVDHKFTGRITPQWIEQWQMDSQITGYLWLVSQLVKKPIRKAWINAIEFSKLPDSNRKCATHGVLYTECRLLHAKWLLIGPLTRTPQQIYEWGETARGLTIALRTLAEWPLEKVNQLPVEGMFTGKCSYCRFRAFCKTGRKPDYAKHLLSNPPQLETLNEQSWGLP